MRWFPVVVLFQIGISVNSWSFVHPVRKIHDRSEAIIGESRDDWETKGKMLYAKEILPTTSILPDTIATALDEIDEEETQDDISTPLSLDLPKSQEITSNPQCSTVESSETTLCPENPTTASTVTEIQEKVQERNLHILNYKNKINIRKGNISFRPVAHVEENSISKNVKQDQNSIKKPIVYSKKIFNLHNNQTKKAIPRVHRLKRDISLKLSKENSDICSDVINQLCSALMTNNYKTGKIKRENELKNDKNGFTVEGFWETPMTQIIGNGIDDVKVQYARPLVSNLNLLNQSSYNGNTDKFIVDPFQMKQINTESKNIENQNKYDEESLNLESTCRSVETKNNGFRLENLQRYTNKWDDKNRKVYSSLHTEQSLKKLGKLAGKLKPLWRPDEEGIENINTSSQGKKGRKYGSTHHYPYSEKSAKTRKHLNENTSEDKNVEVCNPKKEKLIINDFHEIINSNIVLTTPDTNQPLKLTSQQQKEQLNDSSSAWQNPGTELLEFTNFQKPNQHGMNFDANELQCSNIDTQILEENDTNDKLLKAPNQNWISLKSQNTSFINSLQNEDANSLQIPQNQDYQSEGSTYITNGHRKLLAQLTSNGVINGNNNLENKRWEPSSLILTSKEPKIKLNLLSKQNQKVNKWKNCMLKQNQVAGFQQKWGQPFVEAPLFEDFNLMNQKDHFQNTLDKLPHRENKYTQNQVLFAEGLIKPPFKNIPVVDSNQNGFKLNNPEPNMSQLNYDITKLHSIESKGDKVALKSINVQNKNQEDLEIQPMSLSPKIQNLVSKNSQFKNQEANEPSYEDQSNNESINNQADNTFKPKNNNTNEWKTLSTETQQIKNKKNEHLRQNQEGFQQKWGQPFVEAPQMKGLNEDLNFHHEIDQSENELNKFPNSIANIKTSSVSSVHELPLSERIILTVNDSNLKSPSYIFQQHGDIINTSKSLVNYPLISDENPSIYQPRQDELVDMSLSISNNQFKPNEINTPQKEGFPDQPLQHFDNQAFEYKGINETGKEFILEQVQNNMMNLNVPSKRSRPQPSINADTKVTSLLKSSQIVGSNSTLNDNDKMQQLKSTLNLSDSKLTTNNCIIKNTLNPSLKEIQQQWDTVNYVSNPITVESQLFSEQNSLDGELESHQEVASLQTLDKDFVNINYEKQTPKQNEQLMKETCNFEESTPSDSIKLSKLYPRTITIKKTNPPLQILQKTIGEFKDKSECPSLQIINRERKQLTPITTTVENALDNSSSVNTELTNDKNKQENNTEVGKTITMNRLKSEIKHLKNLTSLNMKHHNKDLLVNIEHGKSNTAQYEKNLMENDATDNDLKEILWTKSQYHKKSKGKKLNKTIVSEEDDISTNDSELLDETIDNKRPQSHKSQSHRLSKHQKLKNKIHSKSKSNLTDQDKKSNKSQGKGDENKIFLGVKKRRTVPPINITIAMKNLFNRINPEEVTVSNSSSLGSDGSLKFSIELKDKNSKLYNLNT